MEISKIRRVCSFSSHMDQAMPTNTSEIGSLVGAEDAKLRCCHFTIFVPVGIWYRHIFQLTLSGLWQSGDIYRIYSWCWRFEVYWAGISQKFQQHKHCRPNFSNQQTQWWLYRDRDGGALLVRMMAPSIYKNTYKTIVNDTYNYSLHGVYKPKNITWGAAHCTKL